MEEGKTDSATLQLTVFVLSWSHLCEPVTFCHSVDRDARVEGQAKRAERATEG